MQMQLDLHIEDFVRDVGSGAIEVYNEFSLQHELGLFLRNHLDGCKVEFERNVSHFGLAKSDFAKKEIDIAITSAGSGERLCAIELKYPHNGQVPETMFSFCRDIAFLEQLVRAGFQSAYFLALADHPQFYSGNSSGIYGHFRGGVPITGTITKPTGSKDKQLHVSGSYAATWSAVLGRTKSCLVRVDG